MKIILFLSAGLVYIPIVDIFLSKREYKFIFTDMEIKNDKDLIKN
jgi:hypothetical protein